MGNDHAQVQWSRSQVERALWRYTVTYGNWGTDPEKRADDVPRVFRSRIKKLLNLDRNPVHPPPNKDTWAFFDSPPQGTGSQERFSTMHVFNLGIALDLLNVGCKQSEIVFHIQWSRLRLNDIFEKIHVSPQHLSPVHGTQRKQLLHSQYPGSKPLQLTRNGQPNADFSIWWLLQRIESKELYPRFEATTKDGKSRPLFFEPKVLHGLEEASRYLYEHRAQYRHLVMIELADLALTLPRYLAEAPTVRRGRPAEHGRKRNN